MPTSPAEITAATAEAAPLPNEVHCDRVCLSFGSIEVLRDVTLAVHPGEVLALVGPNGAGKTSLLNCINGVYRPNSGSITIHGSRASGRRPHVIARQGVARTFQGGPASTDMTVLDLAMLGRHVVTRVPALAYGLGVAAVRRLERHDRAYAMDMLSLLGLSDRANAYVADLSFGAAKLADLARALCSRPTVLLLDEPVSGLDSAARSEMVDTIHRIRASLHPTVVLVEHDMSVVRRVADRLAVLTDGRVLRIGDPDSVLRDDEVARAFLGRREPRTDGPDRGDDTTRSEGQA